MPESPVYFVDLVLKDNFGKVLSTNFYWLSAKKNVYDWSAEDNDAFTPVKSYEDLTALSSLPSTGKIRTSVSYLEAGGNVRQLTVELKNTSEQLAFQIHFEVLNKNADHGILPVQWEDNYLCLLPGESRVIHGFVLPEWVPLEQVEFTIDGWNIEPETITQLFGFSANNRFIPPLWR